MNMETIARFNSLPSSLKRLGYSGCVFVINTAWSERLKETFSEMQCPVSVTYKVNRFVYNNSGEGDIFTEFVEISRDGYYFIRDGEVF